MINNLKGCKLHNACWNSDMATALRIIKEDKNSVNELVIL